jgi:hypothetical protein
MRPIRRRSISKTERTCSPPAMPDDRRRRHAFDDADPPFAVPPDIVLDLPAPPSSTARARSTGRPARGEGMAERRQRLCAGGKGRPISPLKLIENPAVRTAHRHVGDHTRTDLDNGLKALIDYLRKIELIEDDSPKAHAAAGRRMGRAPHGCRVTVRPCT